MVVLSLGNCRFGVKHQKRRNRATDLGIKGLRNLGIQGFRD
jgi:hypothetical protein